MIFCNFLQLGSEFQVAGIKLAKTSLISWTVGRLTIAVSRAFFLTYKLFPLWRRRVGVGVGVDVDVGVGVGVDKNSARVVDVDDKEEPPATAPCVVSPHRR